jgi:hypothetical protein
MPRTVLARLLIAWFSNCVALLVAAQYRWQRS